jgi:5-hydroxyisourate hydrolase-like protein (transthyretin family)
MRRGGISIHAVDIRSGRPAAGLKVEVVRLTNEGETEIAAGYIGSNATLSDPRLSRVLPVGRYEARFDARAYFASGSSGPPVPTLLDIIAFAFNVAEPDEHLHLPLKFSPAGFSIFRGNP